MIVSKRQEERTSFLGSVSRRLASAHCTAEALCCEGLSCTLSMASWTPADVRAASLTANACTETFSQHCVFAQTRTGCTETEGRDAVSRGSRHASLFVHPGAPLQRHGIAYFSYKNSQDAIFTLLYSEQVRAFCFRKGALASVAGRCARLRPPASTSKLDVRAEAAQPASIELDERVILLHVSANALLACWLVCGCRSLHSSGERQGHCQLEPHVQLQCRSLC